MEGIKRTFATLLARSEDEIASAYGYAASHIHFCKEKNSFTFYIRPTAQFHDGSPITPEDIIATFTAVNNPAMPHHSGILSGVIKAEKVGKLGVQFTIKKGSLKEKAFLIGTELMILAKKDLQKFPLSSSASHIYLGSGPYKLLPPSHHMKVTYRRISNWWGNNLPVNKGKYNFDTISYDFFYTHEASFEALKAGHIDVREEHVSKRWSKGYNFPGILQGKIEKLHFPHSGISGMMGIVFNLRNPIFQDIRVRKAIALMLDFEWINKNIFDGSYKRLDSFFTGTPFSAGKKPSQKELKLLHPYKKSLPKELFKSPFKNYRGAGDGHIRDRLEKALDLLKNTPWVVKDGKLVHKISGKPFKINILLPSPSYVRFMNNFIKNLKRLGIETSVDIPDQASYKNRKDAQKFDLLAGTFYPVFEIPGSKLDFYWHSKYVHKKGTKNLPGVENPLVDSLLDHIKTAASEKSLITAQRALDRVLLYNHYLIPQWTSQEYRIAKAKFIERPDNTLYHGFGFDTWWVANSNKKSF